MRHTSLVGVTKRSRHWRWTSRTRPNPRSTPRTMWSISPAVATLRYVCHKHKIIRSNIIICSRLWPRDHIRLYTRTYGFLSVLSPHTPDKQLSIFSGYFFGLFLSLVLLPLPLPWATHVVVLALWPQHGMGLCAAPAHRLICMCCNRNLLVPTACYLSLSCSLVRYIFLNLFITVYDTHNNKNN